VRAFKINKIKQYYISHFESNAKKAARRGLEKGRNSKSTINAERTYIDWNMEDKPELDILHVRRKSCCCQKFCGKPKVRKGDHILLDSDLEPYKQRSLA